MNNDLYPLVSTDVTRGRIGILIDPVGTVRRCQRYTLAVPHLSLSTPNFYHPFSEAQRFDFVLVSVNSPLIGRRLELVRQLL